MTIKANPGPDKSGRSIKRNPYRGLHEALKDYNKAIEMAPHNDVFFVSRGMLYFEQKMKREAESDFRRAIELNEDALLFFDEMTKIFPEFDPDL